MILQVIIQTLILPVALSVVSVCIFKKLSIIVTVSQPKTPFSIHGLPALLMISWLLNSCWVLGMPALIPIQASDWFLWVVLASTLLCLSTKEQSGQRVLAIIFVLAVIAKTWTVISYNAGFSSHTFIWLEILVFIVLGIFLLQQSASNILNKVENSIYALIVAFIGGAAALSGSLTIALLGFSLASTVFTATLYQSKALHFSVNKFIVMLTLLLLLHVRQYAEADLFSVTALFVSLILLFQRQFTARLRYMLIVLSLMLVASNLIFSYWSTVTQPYY